MLGWLLTSYCKWTAVRLRAMSAVISEVGGKLAFLKLGAQRD